MQLGMIGLGRMGANMVRRLQKGDHECVVYDVREEAINNLMPLCPNCHRIAHAKPGGGVFSLAELQDIATSNGA